MAEKLLTGSATLDGGGSATPSKILTMDTEVLNSVTVGEFSVSGTLTSSGYIDPQIAYPDLVGEFSLSGTLRLNPSLRGRATMRMSGSASPGFSGGLRGSIQFSAGGSANPNFSRQPAMESTQAGFSLTGSLRKNPTLSGAAVMRGGGSARPSRILLLAGTATVTARGFARPIVILSIAPEIGAWVLFQSNGQDSGTVGSIGQRWRRKANTEQLTS